MPTAPQELVALLYYDGFTITRQYGDWNETPLGATSPSIISVCRKRTTWRVAAHGSERAAMKGGKAGRKRRASTTGAGAQAGPRDKAKKAGAKRVDGPPKKGSRKKTYGGRSSSGDE